MAVTGTVAVALVGLVALEAFGEGAALAALVLAAFYPVMIELSGALVAENLVVVLELAAAWTMLRARRGRRPYLWVAGAGVLTGLCALTHENAILYLLPFGVAAWGIARGRDRPPPRRAWLGRVRPFAAPAILVVMACLTILPWTIRNAVELHHFVPIADETGITLAGTYNPTSANTPGVPYKWHLFSHVPSLHYLAHESNGLTEVQLSDKLQTQAFDYIKAHPLAPIEAGFDNTLRMLELEGTYAWHASAAALNLHEPWPTIGVYLVLPAGVGRARRRVHPPGPARSAVAVGDAPAVVDHDRVRQRRDAPFPGADRSVPADAGRVRAQRRPGTAARQRQDWAVRQSGVVGARPSWRVTRLSWSRWSSAWPEPTATQVSGESAR